jgi:glyoxylase I family protein
VTGRHRPKIAGLGGVFLYADRPARLAAWYQKSLGIPLVRLEGGIFFAELRDPALPRSGARCSTTFAIFPAERRLGPRREQVMVNFHVTDLVGFARILRRRGVRVEPVTRGQDAGGIGRFTHLRDPERNRIELWEPSGRS